MSNRKAIILPSRGSKPAGLVTEAEFCSGPAFASRQGKATGKRREGQLYERRAQYHLSEVWGPYYVEGPWIRFWNQSSERPRYCQPDGLLIDFHNRTFLTIEIKLKHTTDAWWQLRHLYQPVLANLFPPTLWTHKVCEVVRWYEPGLHFPEQIALVPDPLAVQGTEFGVHIWNPKM